MALALYRKYRPRTFSEIIGQEHVTEPLSQALRSDRLHHAYLFSGPRGCGKTSSARILARSLNCEKGPTPDPCGECDSCRALAPDGAGSIDVIEIDAASHGGVDDARDLRERAFFAPVSSRFKIYVIDEAHMVSSAGFNALLKLVEEPPEYVKFVFATTEPEKVLGTIKSRTHHYPFRLIPPSVLRPYLEQLCVAEGVAVEPAVFPLVVRAGGGSARDSLSVLDQLISGAGTEGVTYARAVALLGVTDVALIDEVCDSLAAGDGRGVYTTIDRVAEAGHDARRFAGDLLERLRDLIVLQQVPDAVEKGLLDGADDELARMTVQAQQFGPATLSRMADIVHTGLTDMRGTTAPRLILELITARMLLPGSDDSTAALLARMERMERRLTLTGGDAPAADSTPAPPAVRPAAGPDPATARPSGTSTPEVGGPGQPASAAHPPVTPPSASAASPSMPASPTGQQETSVARPSDDPSPTVGSSPTAASPAAAPAPSASLARTEPVPGAVDAVAVRRIWEEVLAMVGRKSRRAAAYAREATVRDVDGDVLVLTFKHAFHAEAVAAAPELLIEAVYEVLGGRWRVRCEVTGQANRQADSPAGPSRAPASRPVRDGRGTQPTEPAATSAPQPARGPDAAARGPIAPAPEVGGGEISTRGVSASAAPDAVTRGAAVSGAAAQPQLSSVRSAPAPHVGAAQAARVEAVEEDWPTPAPLGGAGADGGSPPAQPEPARSVPATRRTAAPSGQGATAAPASPGRTTARAAAGRPGSARAAGRDDDWAGSGGEEPPYDPEFDPPMAGAADSLGFDPGDEPVDDDSAPVVRQTTEQQALELLRDALGAERISESDAR